MKFVLIVVSAAFLMVCSVCDFAGLSQQTAVIAGDYDPPPSPPGNPDPPPPLPPDPFRKA
jgi:U5 snRNP spliceosome subunit